MNTLAGRHGNAGVVAEVIHDILVLYEDVGMGKRAKVLCDSLENGLGERYKLEVSYWSFEVLRFTDLLRAVAETARRATLIVVAADGKRPLPSWVKTLVAMFLYGEPNGECAVVALLSMPSEHGQDFSPAYAYLKRTASAAQLALFSHVIELDEGATSERDATGGGRLPV
jgi:hypothetical protein